jgi:DivIVA domain-containing protein
LRADDVRGKQFSSTDDGYDKKQVAAFLDAAGIRLAVMESTDRPAGALVSGAILAEWARVGRLNEIFNHPPPAGGLRDAGGGRLPERAA